MRKIVIQTFLFGMMILIALADEESAETPTESEQNEPKIIKIGKFEFI